MADTIAEFLVALGFKVDPAQHNRFTDALKDSHQRIEALGKGMTTILDRFAALATAATGASIGLATALNNVGHNLSQLGFAAERIGSAPQNIRAYEFAIKQMGGTAEEARSSLERVAAAQRLQPGILQAFGIAPGTDTVEAMMKLADRWRNLMSQGAAQTSQAVQEAQKYFGIDQAQLLRMTSAQTPGYYRQELAQEQRMGLNLPNLVEIGKETDRQLNLLRQQYDDFVLSLEQEWGPKYNHALSVINEWFKEHIPEIQNYVRETGRQLEALITSITDWWKSLSPAGQQNVEAIGIIVALRTLGSLPIFGMVGKILGLATVIGYLITTYQHWKETGQSEGFIDWNKWGPVIETATRALEYFNNNIIGPLAEKLGIKTTFLPAFEALAAFLAGPMLLRAALGGGLGGVLRLLAMVPGSGISTAMLAGLGIIAAPGGIAAGMMIGTNPIASQESENQQLGGSLAERHPELRTGKPTTDQLQQSKGWFGTVKSWFGMGVNNIDPGKQHTADEIITYLMAKGWTREQAAGIAANIIAESGGRPRIVNESGHAGLAQWDQGRQKAFKEKFGHAMTDATVSDEQLFREELDFIDIELHGSEGAAGKKVSMETTAEGAAVAFGQGFERYASGASPEDAKRAGMASTIMRRNLQNASLQGGAINAAALTPTPAAYNGATVDQSRGDVNVNAPTNVTINGISDPERAATLVNRNQERQSANLVRHLQAVYV